ncbi:MAG: PLD nuclease N-terminal domain-containing protein [Anaerolineae bacterium]
MPRLGSTELLLLIPLLLLEVGLMASALIDLSRRQASQVRGGNKLLWILVIVLISLFGPLAYYLYGRQE